MQGYHVIKGWRERANTLNYMMRRSARPLHVFAIAALAVGVVSMYQSSVAQLQDPAQVLPVNVTYGIEHSGHPSTICIGETFEIGASIVAKILPPENSNAPVRENAAVFTATGATLSATHSAILTSTSTPDSLGRFRVERPMRITFKFKGVEEGNTSIKFDGEVRTEFYTFPVTAETTVRVIACRLQVLVNGRWFQRLIGGTVTVYATVYDGVLTGNSSNGVFTGEANVAWRVYAAIPQCSESNTLTIGRVTMRGQVGQDDRIRVELYFDSVPGAETVACLAGGNTSAVFARANPLTASVPLQGGAVILQQALGTPAGFVEGKTYLWVYTFPE